MSSNESTAPIETQPPALRLAYAAVSDQGRVRKDNQDSGYAGPWLLAVADGVGGAARGDIASSTTITALRNLDARPDVSSATDEEDVETTLLELVAAALERAQDQIGGLVAADPALAGTSTTASIALFDGHRLAVGHVGDSRAYLLRHGSLTQLTKDHTFVQTLIDEGRITEEEARFHPHRNLILRALDGIHETEPDLFIVDLEPRDRIMLCSDGISGPFAPDQIATLLGKGTPQEAAQLLVTESLDAGSTDNVTCIVADVTSASGLYDPPTTPVLVGAVTSARKHTTKTRRQRRTPLDPEQVDVAPEPGADAPPAQAVVADPDDTETSRYALTLERRKPWRAVVIAAVVIAAVVAAVIGGRSWNERQWYLGESGGKVAIFRGTDTTLLGFDLSHVYQRSSLALSELPDPYADQIRAGIPRASLADARAKIAELRGETTPSPAATPTPSVTPSATPSVATTTPPAAVSTP